MTLVWIALQGVRTLVLACSPRRNAWHPGFVMHEMILLMHFCVMHFSTSASSTYWVVLVVPVVPVVIVVPMVTVGPPGQSLHAATHADRITGKTAHVCPLTSINMPAWNAASVSTHGPLLPVRPVGSASREGWHVLHVSAHAFGMSSGQLALGTKVSLNCWHVYASMPFKDSHTAKAAVSSLHAASAAPMLRVP